MEGEELQPARKPHSDHKSNETAVDEADNNLKSDGDGGDKKVEAVEEAEDGSNYWTDATEAVLRAKLVVEEAAPVQKIRSN